MSQGEKKVNDQAGPYTQHQSHIRRYHPIPIYHPRTNKVYGKGNSNQQKGEDNHIITTSQPYSNQTKWQGNPSYGLRNISHHRKTSTNGEKG